MGQKIKITKGSIQETLLLPLWGRAYEAQKNNPQLIDKKAVEILKTLIMIFQPLKKLNQCHSMAG